MLSGVSEYELPQDPRWELSRGRYVLKKRNLQKGLKQCGSQLYNERFSLTLPTSVEVPSCKARNYNSNVVVFVHPSFYIKGVQV